jgi:hypothetical protein
VKHCGYDYKGRYVNHFSEEAPYTDNDNHTPPMTL